MLFIIVNAKSSASPVYSLLLLCANSMRNSEYPLNPSLRQNLNSVDSATLARLANSVMER